MIRSWYFLLSSVRCWRSGWLVKGWDLQRAKRRFGLWGVHQTIWTTLASWDCVWRLKAGLNPPICVVAVSPGAGDVVQGQGCPRGAGAAREMLLKMPNKVCNYGFIRVTASIQVTELVGSGGDSWYLINREVTRGKEVLSDLARQHLSKLKPNNCSLYVRVLVISHIPATYFWGVFFQPCVLKQLFGAWQHCNKEVNCCVCLDSGAGNSLMV